MRHEWFDEKGRQTMFVRRDQPDILVLPWGSARPGGEQVLCRELLRLAERVRELEAEPLRARIQELRDELAGPQEWRDERLSLIGQVADLEAILKRLEAENARLRLSDARLTSLRLEVETLKLSLAKYGFEPEPPAAAEEVESVKETFDPWHQEEGLLRAVLKPPPPAGAELNEP